jgi:hypothetical protein
MHFMPDTEDEDSAAETFWPEGYKQVIREDLRQAVARELEARRRFRKVYSQVYAERYPSYEDFLTKVADMVAVGAENGADEAFDEIVDAFLSESALPDQRRYVAYLWPATLPRKVRDKLHAVIVDEYRQDDIYRFAYQVGYKDDFPTFDDFMDQVAQLVMTGTRNGADDMLEGIYRSMMMRERLAPARRNPRRLKTW